MRGVYYSIMRTTRGERGEGGREGGWEGGMGKLYRTVRELTQYMPASTYQTIIISRAIVC